MVGDTLVALDYDLKTVKPGLAKSWSVSEDGKTYTFNLKEGVKFCSGKEFTAQDVVDNINRWRDPATKGVVTWRAGPVKEVRAKDKLTVEYELTKPYSELLFQMTQHFHTIINVDQAKELGDDFGQCLHRVVHRAAKRTAVQIVLRAGDNDLEGRQATQGVDDRRLLLAEDGRVADDAHVSGQSVAIGAQEVRQVRRADLFLAFDHKLHIDRQPTLRL